jgi:nitrate/nitrite sensing protein/histidine kinase/DNA gyrase B/HSP90-like ATPase
VSDVRERASAGREDSSSRRPNGSDRALERGNGRKPGRRPEPDEPDLPFDRLTEPAPKPRPRRLGNATVGGGTISRRVARILALPAVVVLVLLALLAAGEVRDYNQSKDTSRSVKLALSVQDLVQELQTERGITAAVLGGNPSFRAELGPSRRLVDSQRATVSQLIAADGGVSEDARARVSDALGQLDGLDSVRQETDSGKGRRAATFTYFTERISGLSAIDVGLDNTGDTELRRGVTTLQALGDLAEATSQERAFLNGVFSAGGFGKGEFQQFATMRAERLAALARFNRLATPSEREAMNFVFNTGAARVFADFEQVALDAADGHHIIVNPQSWWSGLTTVLDDLQQLQKHVGSEIQIRAADLQTGAARRIGGLIALVVVCFGLSIYLARLASRSITRPLAALAAEADSVASERLPAAVRQLQGEGDGARPAPPAPVMVPDNATAEIHSVAGALDRLQTSAYGLATDQAVQRRDTIESMANLGRRNQNLIRRQLGFITSLEREEVDPTALANLFELDHLATRMRRNAASLLVLVDASTPRQWSTAVSVADMIRAAVSEVEEYRRVTLRRLDEAYVQGSAVGSIAHLLAELIENGLTFSPPDMDVEVQGRRLVDGYLIAITDQGVGMSATDLDRANARLKGEGDFIAAPTRFLGHFVIGKLARETGVKVELLPSPATGITARITLPAGLLGAGSSVEVRAVADQPAEAPAPPRSAAEVPAGSSHLLALPQRDDDDTAAQTPSPWESPSFRRSATPPSGTPVAPAARTDPADPADPADPVDPNRTPSSGVPIVPAAAAYPATPGNGVTPGNRTVPGNEDRVTPTTTGDLPVRHPATGEIPVADAGRPQWQPNRRGPWGSAPPLARPEWPDSGNMRLPGRASRGHGGPDAPAEIDLRDGARHADPLTDPLPGSSGPVPGEQRTQNGLRKRVPRTTRPAAGAAPADSGHRGDPPTRQSALVGGSAADVGARMTALRAGLSRGQSTGPEGQTAPRSAEDGQDIPAEGS